MHGQAEERSHSETLSVETSVFRRPLHLRIYRAFLRRLERWFGISIFFVHRRPLGFTSAVPADVHRDYEFREVAERELLDFASDESLELPRDGVRAAAQRGDVFFGVLHAGRLIGYRWYSLCGTAPCEKGMTIRYAHPDRAYGYRTFTHPAHRGRRLHLYSVTESDAFLLSRGYNHTVGYIAAHNLSSLRFNTRLRGVQRVGFIVLWRIFGRYFFLHSPGAIRHHMRMLAPKTSGDRGAH
jgi:hypothetical protein